MKRPSVLPVVLSLCMLPGACAAESSAAAGAVRAARETPAPDWSAHPGRMGEVLSGFGGGSLEAAVVRERESLWRQGAGSLTAPGEARTVACRNAADPECRAVQVLDRGFPDRPAVPDDMLLGRDEVVNGSGITAPGGVTGAAGCRDFTLAIPALRRTETCRLGEPFAERTCITGTEVSAVAALARWRCTKRAERTSSLACRTTVAPTFATDVLHVCRWDASVLAPEREEDEVTSATASAAFPATCRAPQQAVTELTCSETLSVTGAPSCTPGTTVSVTASGDATLLEDGCAGFDALTLEHECAEERDGRRKVTASVNGSASRGVIRGIGTVRIRSGRCTATVTTSAHDCTTTAAGGLSCLVRARAVVTDGSVETGRIEAVLAYRGLTAGGGLEESWSDGCSALKKESE